MRRQSEKYVIEGSKYPHWVGRYLSLHLNWVLGPFVHGRLQNLQTSEVTFAQVITPLTISQSTIHSTVVIKNPNAPYIRHSRARDQNFSKNFGR